MSIVDTLTAQIQYAYEREDYAAAEALEQRLERAVDMQRLQEV